MSDVKVHAGDFIHGSRGMCIMGSLNLKTREHPWCGESIKLTEITDLEVASEESVKRLGGTVGWGLAAGALFGPVGLVAGLLAGGRKKHVTFVAKFRDGRRLLATTDNQAFVAMQAAIF